MHPFLAEVQAVLKFALSQRAQRARRWRQDREAAHFQPMAVLLDERIAFKPSQPVTSSCIAPMPAAERSVPPACAPALAAAASRPRAAASTTTPTPGRDLTALIPSPRLVLKGRMADVCQQLERLAWQEEQFLRAG